MERRRDHVLTACLATIVTGCVINPADMTVAQLHEARLEPPPRCAEAFLECSPDWRECRLVRLTAERRNAVNGGLDTWAHCQPDVERWRERMAEVNRALRTADPKPACFQPPPAMLASLGIESESADVATVQGLHYQGKPDCMRAVCEWRARHGLLCEATLSESSPPAGGPPTIEAR